MTPPFLPSLHLPDPRDPHAPRAPHDRPRRSSFWQELAFCVLPVLITEAAETLREYLRRKRRKKLNTLLEELAEEAEEMAGEEGVGDEKPGDSADDTDGDE